MESLTEKQELFCNEYIIDFNATRAAKAAGYSEDTAKVIGWENLTKPYLQARIAELRKELADKLNLNKERVLQEYSKIAFFDIRKIYTDDGSLKAVSDIDDDSAAAIAGIEVYEEKINSKDEDSESIGSTKKIKVADKRAALDSICKVLGYNAPSELTGKGGIPLIPNSPQIIVQQVGGAALKTAEEDSKDSV